MLNTDVCSTRLCVKSVVVDKIYVNINYFLITSIIGEITVLMLGFFIIF